jgi:hypothetical protein
MSCLIVGGKEPLFGSNCATIMQPAISPDIRELFRYSTLRSSLIPERLIFLAGKRTAQPHPYALFFLDAQRRPANKNEILTVPKRELARHGGCEGQSQ